MAWQVLLLTLVKLAAQADPAASGWPARLGPRITGPLVYSGTASAAKCQTPQQVKARAAGAAPGAQQNMTQAPTCMQDARSHGSSTGCMHLQCECLCCRPASLALSIPPASGVTCNIAAYSLHCNILMYCMLFTPATAASMPSAADSGTCCSRWAKLARLQLYAEFWHCHLKCQSQRPQQQSHNAACIAEAATAASAAAA